MKLSKLMLVAAAMAIVNYPVAVVAKAAAAVWAWVKPADTAVPGFALGANTLTGLFPTLYEALNVVSRELIGFIPAVTRDSNATRAALNQTVRVPIAAVGAVEDITPGQLPADTANVTIPYADITITKSKAVPIRWNGEEEKSLGTAGTYNKILADQFTEAFRTLANLVEVDLAAIAKASASRAYGTAGTTPFGTANDLSDLAGVAQIMDVNGAPPSGRQLVLNSASMANLRGKQSVLFKVNEAGSSDMLRDGMTSRLQNFAIRYSGGISLHTKGTGASYLLNDASASVGDTTIAADTGTGTILAGDIVTFAGTSDKYVVNSALASGSFVIGKPGLLAAEADNDAITVGNNYTGNFAFNQSSIILVARAPAVPSGGDSADDAMMLTDPYSGLTFEIRVYRQYRQVKFEVCLAWGVAGIKPEHGAILLG